MFERAGIVVSLDQHFLVQEGVCEWPSRLWEKPVLTHTLLRVCCGETVTYKEPALQRLAGEGGIGERGVYKNMPHRLHSSPWLGLGP